MTELTRRSFAIGVLAASTTPVLGRAMPGDADLAALEASSGGRLGVVALDTGSGRRLDWRADERFAMCSTFKTLLAAAVLARVDRGAERLDRRVAVVAGDIVVHSPAVAPRVGGTMAVGELCEATITISDNAAANLLLREIGGPAALTRWLRATGDRVTRLDRTEPALNIVPAGDLRDTTTPAAMATTTRRLLFGHVLAPSSRERLAAWLVATRTGDARLRAGLPASWRVGDKTGTWADSRTGRGTSNDVAVAWPPGRAPLLIAAYLTDSTLGGPARDAIIAEVARLAAQRLA
jgi:beta-lactamase class A